MAERNIVIFGAGKIGRSFIGQLFGRAGYEVIFVDLDAQLVDALNARGSYPVIIKGRDHENHLSIKNVRAIHALKSDEVYESVCRAGLLAVSAGKAALPSIASSIAGGLMQRESVHPGKTLDIILAENMLSAAAFFRNELKKRLPLTYPVDQRVGLVESSIGKMVPIMTARDLELDPLQVFAEPYNTLIP